MKRVIFIIILLAAGTISIAQNVLDRINPLFRGELDGNKIRNYYAHIEAPPIVRNVKNKDNQIIPGIFHSNKLFVQTGLNSSGIIEELKSFRNNHQTAVALFDSTPVIATASGINSQNASAYEFRVLLNQKQEIVHWRPVTMFCQSYTLRYNADGSEQTVMAYLGEFVAPFGNSLTIEIRKKTDTLQVSAIIAVWLNRAPSVIATFSNNEMSSFLSTFKEQWRHDFISPQATYYGDIESLSSDSLVTRRDFKPSENNIIFYLADKVKTKDIIEYNLVSGNHENGWKPNDFDLNLIWLKNLSPGKYILKMRYSLQRQNTSEYEFNVQPAWHQTVTARIIAGILSLISLGFILLVLKVTKQREKIRMEQFQKKQMQTELKSLRSQFNPHFVFNALNSIQGLINKNDIDAANKYLNEFSSLLRDSLKESNTETVSLATEIRMLDSYLKLEQLRFGFTYSINRELAINMNAIEVPSLLLQPLVENAVKHGISKLYDKGRLTIAFEKSSSDMVVTISDNGSGFNQNPKTNGYGLNLTEERIELLNRTLKEQSIKFSIGSSGTGTNAQLVFKNWLS